MDSPILNNGWSNDVKMNQEDESMMLSSFTNDVTINDKYYCWWDSISKYSLIIIFKYVGIFLCTH